MVLGAKTSLTSKRLSRANARLEMFTRIEADLHAQYVELTELRERVKKAQLSADLQNGARAFEPAPVVIATAA
jgi:hypothetical protein